MNVRLMEFRPDYKRPAYFEQKMMIFATIEESRQLVDEIVRVVGSLEENDKLTQLLLRLNDELLKVKATT